MPDFWDELASCSLGGPVLPLQRTCLMMQIERPGRKELWPSRANPRKQLAEDKVCPSSLSIDMPGTCLMGLQFNTAQTGNC